MGLLAEGESEWERSVGRLTFRELEMIAESIRSGGTTTLHENETAERTAERDEAGDAALIAICDALEVEVGSMEQSIEQQSQEQQGKKRHAHRGIHKDKNRGYVACIGCNTKYGDGSVYIVTRSTKSLQEAVEWHMHLVGIRQLLKQYSTDGQNFDEALQGAVETSSDDQSKSPTLSFCAIFWAGRKKVTTPTRSCVELVLRDRQRLANLREAKEDSSKLVEEGLRMIEEAKNERDVAMAAKRKEREQQKRERHEKPNVRHRLLQFVRIRLRMIGQRLRWRSTPAGLNAVCLDQGSGLVHAVDNVCVFAELLIAVSCGATDLATAGHVLCRGPLRNRSSEATADLQLLQQVRAASGDEAAKEMALRLDTEAMVAKFCADI